MAHLITSHKGADHVESKHAAHWNAGTLGNGCYVLPIGSKLACTMTDSNTLRVLFGVGSVCGYDWEIEGDYEEVDIDNGVPGYNRIDLLVARVETAPAEKVELKVYKGEETTGTPVVPGHVEGDLNDGDTVCEMPICSVRVNGINPQAPVMLVEESIDIMALLEELRDYKSQMQTAEGINAGGIASAKLADGAVTSAKIADGGVGTADLAAKAVTDAKLSDAVAYKVNGGGILWSGSWYVSNEQTVALSRAVSEQRTGIVLVFSAWSDSGANNAYFASFFVPKQAVASHPGCGWTFDLSPVDKAGMSKYLYISDKSIKGVASNAGSATSPAGLKAQNHLYVLRYVIGV